MKRHRPSTRDPYRSLRYPWQPLETYLRAALRPRNDDSHHGQLCDEDFAIALGTNRQQISRWRRVGLSEPSADRFSNNLGIHVGLLWPEYWDVDIGA